MSTLCGVIEVVGAPFDLSGHRQGSRLGPEALRLAGLKGSLESAGLEWRDAGDIACDHDDGPLSPSRRWRAAIEALAEVKKAVGTALGADRTPLVVGGDHSVAIGAISAALEKHGGDLAVLWIDAHADLNTPQVSPSGNLHGMPLAALMGFPSGVQGEIDGYWSRIQDEIVPKSRLQGGKTAWLGLRDVDPGEKARFTEIRSEFTATMYDIDRYGMVEALLRFDKWMRASGAKRLWISFDVDALDPILAPGTGTAVRGGLTYREMHLSGEMLHELMAEKDCPYSLAGIDLVEVNPLYDTNNETALTAVEWIASLFGKTILGKR